MTPLLFGKLGEVSLGDASDTSVPNLLILCLFYCWMINCLKNIAIKRLQRLWMSGLQVLSKVSGGERTDTGGKLQKGKCSLFTVVCFRDSTSERGGKQVGENRIGNVSKIAMISE